MVLNGAGLLDGRHVSMPSLVRASLTGAGSGFAGASSIQTKVLKSDSMLNRFKKAMASSRGLPVTIAISWVLDKLTNTSRSMIKSSSSLRPG